MNLETLLEIFPNLIHYIELAPVLCVSLLAGIASFYNQTNDDGSVKTKKDAMRVIGTSAFLGLISYSLLSATDLPYLARVGISATIGFFGIDKTIEIVQKLLSLRNGGGQTDKEKTAELKESLKKVKKENKENENLKESKE